MAGVGAKPTRFSLTYLKNESHYLLERLWSSGMIVAFQVTCAGSTPASRIYQ